MKFKYNINKNFYKMYGEANYLVINKKRYLKGFNKPIKNYLTEVINMGIISLFLALLSLFIKKIVLNYLVLLLFIIYIVYGYIALFSYLNYKKSNHKGEIIIDKNGITDNSDINITFPWDKIELIGITKNMLAIVLDSPFVIILEPNLKIIKEIEKYKEVRIIKNKQI